jgi:uncharacterized membrane protein
VRSTAPLTGVIAAVALAVAIVFVTQSGLRDSWYFAFKSVHVIAAVVWIGGGMLLVILGVAAEIKRDPAELATVARQAALVGERLFAPAGLVVLLMGIAMMLNTNWGWGKFWVIVGLLGYAATFITGVAVLSPMARKASRLIAEKGADDPETTAHIQRILLVARVDMAVLFLVIVDMVAKPFA